MSSNATDQPLSSNPVAPSAEGAGTSRPPDPDPATTDSADPGPATPGPPPNT